MLPPKLESHDPVDIQVILENSRESRWDKNDFMAYVIHGELSWESSAVKIH